MKKVTDVKLYMEEGNYKDNCVIPLRSGMHLYWVEYLMAKS